MRNALSDARHAVRSLARAPGLATLAVLTLTLGIGLPTVMFAVVNGVFRDLPVPSPERVLRLSLVDLERGGERWSVPHHTLADWRAQQTSFEGLAGVAGEDVTLSGGDARPLRHDAAYVTANAFSVLAVDPILGRTFAEEDAAAGAPPVAILSHALWQDRFAGAPDAIGRTLSVDGVPHTVVGVMGPGFGFPGNQPLWLPLRLRLDAPRADADDLEAFGRLRDGVSVEAANAELATISARLARAYPDTDASVEARAAPYSDGLIDPGISTGLFTMMGAVSFILLIACVNVANLLLGRAIGRRRELVVRSALGASRARVASQFIVESLVVAAAGGLLGAGLAWAGTSLLQNTLAGLAGLPWIDVRVDGTALLFVAGVVVLSALLAGVLPALTASTVNLGEALNDAPRGASSGGSRAARLGRSLVVVEIALSCALLSVSGLLIKGVLELRATDYGMPVERIVTGEVEVPRSVYPTATSRVGFFEELEARVGAIPGVIAAGMMSDVPGTIGFRRPVTFPGDAGAPETTAATLVVSPGFLATLDAAVLEGRAFDARDAEAAEPVALINRSLADRAFPGERAVGRTLDLGGGPRTIVGVVPDLFMGDVRRPGANGPGIYVPMTQVGGVSMQVFARTTLDPLSIIPQLRDALQSLDPDLALMEADRVDRMLAGSTADLDVFGKLFLFFGIVALFLASVGLYGVMSFAVRQRTREWGVRIALGASAGRVLTLASRRALSELGIGLAAGLVIAGFLSAPLASFFYRVDPWDPAVFALVSVVLAGVGLAATLIPARRATRVDPVDTLRRT